MALPKKIPTKIKIFGRTIKVVRAELKEHEFGEYEQHKYLIKISKKSDYEEARQTLFHEAIHAALHISGLSEMIPQEEKQDLEEAIVICLENAFSDIVDIEKLAVDNK